MHLSIVVFECPYCPKRFQALPFLQSHIQRRHQGLPLLPISLIPSHHQALLQYHHHQPGGLTSFSPQLVEPFPTTAVYAFTTSTAATHQSLGNVQSIAATHHSLENVQSIAATHQSLENVHSTAATQRNVQSIAATHQSLENAQSIGATQQSLENAQSITATHQKSLENVKSANQPGLTEINSQYNMNTSAATVTNDDNNETKENVNVSTSNTGTFAQGSISKGQEELVTKYEEPSQQPFIKVSSNINPNLHDLDDVVGATSDDNLLLIFPPTAPSTPFSSLNDNSRIHSTTIFNLVETYLEQNLVSRQNLKMSQELRSLRELLSSQESLLQNKLITATTAYEDQLNKLKQNSGFGEQINALPTQNITNDDTIIQFTKMSQELHSLREQLNSQESIWQNKLLTAATAYEDQINQLRKGSGFGEQINALPTQNNANDDSSANSVRDSAAISPSNNTNSGDGNPNIVVPVAKPRKMKTASLVGNLPTPDLEQAALLREPEGCHSPLSPNHPAISTRSMETGTNASSNESTGPDGASPSVVKERAQATNAPQDPSTVNKSSSSTTSAGTCTIKSSGQNYAKDGEILSAQSDRKLNSLGEHSQDSVAHSSVIQPEKDTLEKYKKYLPRKENFFTGTVQGSDSEEYSDEDSDEVDVDPTKIGFYGDEYEKDDSYASRRKHRSVLKSLTPSSQGDKSDQRRLTVEQGALLPGGIDNKKLKKEFKKDQIRGTFQELTNYSKRKSTLEDSYGKFAHAKESICTSRSSSSSSSPTSFLDQDGKNDDKAFRKKTARIRNSITSDDNGLSEGENTEKTPLELVRERTSAEIENQLEELGIMPGASTIGIQEMSRALRHLNGRRRSLTKEPEGLDLEWSKLKGPTPPELPSRSIHQKLEKANKMLSPRRAKAQPNSWASMLNKVKKSGSKFKKKVSSAITRSKRSSPPPPSSSSGNKPPRDSKSAETSTSFFSKARWARQQDPSLGKNAPTTTKESPNPKRKNIKDNKTVESTTTSSSSEEESAIDVEMPPFMTRSKPIPHPLTESSRTDSDEEDANHYPNKNHYKSRNKDRNADEEKEHQKRETKYSTNSSRFSENLTAGTNDVKGRNKISSNDSTFTRTAAASTATYLNDEDDDAEEDVPLKSRSGSGGHRQGHQGLMIQELKAKLSERAANMGKKNGSRKSSLYSEKDANETKDGSASVNGSNLIQMKDDRGRNIEALDGKVLKVPNFFVNGSPVKAPGGSGNNGSNNHDNTVRVTSNGWSGNGGSSLSRKAGKDEITGKIPAPSTAKCPTAERNDCEDKSSNLNRLGVGAKDRDFKLNEQNENIEEEEWTEASSASEYESQSEDEDGSLEDSTFGHEGTPGKKTPATTTTTTLASKPTIVDKDEAVQKKTRNTSHFSTAPSDPGDERRMSFSRLDGSRKGFRGRSWKNSSLSSKSDQDGDFNDGQLSKSKLKKFQWQEQQPSKSKPKDPSASPSPSQISNASSQLTSQSPSPAAQKRIHQFQPKNKSPSNPQQKQDKPLNLLDLKKSQNFSSPPTKPSRYLSTLQPQPKPQLEKSDFTITDTITGYNKSGANQRLIQGKNHQALAKKNDESISGKSNINVFPNKKPAAALSHQKQEKSLSSRLTPHSSDTSFWELDADVNDQGDSDYLDKSPNNKRNSQYKERILGKTGKEDESNKDLVGGNNNLPRKTSNAVPSTSRKSNWKQGESVQPVDATVTRSLATKETLLQSHITTGKNIRAGNIIKVGGGNNAKRVAKASFGENSWDSND